MVFSPVQSIFVEHKSSSAPAFRGYVPVLLWQPEQRHCIVRFTYCLNISVRPLLLKTQWGCLFHLQEVITTNHIKKRCRLQLSTVWKGTINNSHTDCSGITSHSVFFISRQPNEDVTYASIDHSTSKGLGRTRATTDDDCDYATVVPAALQPEPVSDCSSKDECADDYVLMGWIELRKVLLGLWQDL